MTVAAVEPAAVAPRYATPRSPERRSYGRAIAHVADSLGKPLMPWQRLVVDVGTELLDDGSWAYPVVIVTVQRQSGKTTLVAPVNAHRCTVKRDARTWLTAQTRQDARDTWGEVSKLVGRSPFGPYVTRRRSNGSEELAFPTGSSFRVFAPTEDALHGKANELVTVDEVWAFDDEQGTALEQAILPTFATTGGQLWLLSTAGHAGSAWLRRYVDLGRAAVESGRRSGVAYFEFALSDEDAAIVEVELQSDDPARRRRALELILRAHPAAGYTLRLDALEQAADTMSPGDFLRAYGNRWSKATERVIPLGPWQDAQASAWPEPTVPVALGFDVALDRSSASIVAAWRDAPGERLRLDLVECHPGTAWLADRVAELVEARKPVAVAHVGGPALDVADELAQRGVKVRGQEVLGLTATEYATACVGFLSDVVNGRLSVRTDPDLDAAVDAAAQRPLGEAWAWSRRQAAGSIAPLVAATAARFAYDHKPPPPVRPLVVARRPSSTAQQRRLRA